MKRKPDKAKVPDRPKVEAKPEEIHPPEWAEDIEHALRRLISARQKKRARRPGLYL